MAPSPAGRLRRAPRELAAKRTERPGNDLHLYLLGLALRRRAESAGQQDLSPCSESRQRARTSCLTRVERCVRRVFRHRCDGLTRPFPRESDESPGMRRGGLSWPPKREMITRTKNWQSFADFKTGNYLPTGMSGSRANVHVASTFIVQRLT